MADDFLRHNPNRPEMEARYKRAVAQAVRVVLELRSYDEAKKKIVGIPGVERRVAGLKRPTKTADDVIEEVTQGDYRLWSQLMNEVTQELARIDAINNPTESV